MLHTLETLFPVFAVLGLGYGLARKKFLSKAFLDELNRLVYWVCLPALMISSLDKAQSLPGGSITIVLIYTSVSFCVAGISWLVSKALKLESWQSGTFMQGTIRGNIAFIGIPILLYVYRDMEPGALSVVLAQAIFVFAPLMILHNVFSVMIMVGSRHGLTLRSIPESLKGMVRNPLVIAAVVGLSLQVLPVDLPMVLTDTLKFIGRMAAPAALVCVGGGMALTSMEGRYRSATYASVMKVFLMPIIAYLFSLPFDLSPTGTMILMVFSAAPSAVAGYVMVKEMNGDAPMASGTIIISTLLSAISLGIVVTLF